jgi:hypothetical protein
MSIASNAGQRYRDIRSTEKNDKYISIIFRSTTNPLFYDRFFDVEGKTSTLNKSEATTREGDYVKTRRSRFGKQSEGALPKQDLENAIPRRKTSWKDKATTTYLSDYDFEDTTKWRERILRGHYKVTRKDSTSDRKEKVAPKRSSKLGHVGSIQS